MGGLCGILVVEPEQLLPLVNGTLRLDHRRVGAGWGSCGWVEG